MKLSGTSSTSRRPSRSDGIGATFGQLLDQWLEECERLDLSPTTLRTYRSQIKTTIRPRLGKVILCRLTVRHLDELYGTMKDAGQSPKTIRNHHAIISAALHQGVRWGWIRTNIAEMAKPPRVEHRQVKAPSVEVVREVIESAVQRDPRLAPLLMLAALTGLRRGELCALRWTDVDLQLGIIEVSRSLVVVPGGLAEKTTKTGRSRKVALDAFGIALLTGHRAQVVQWIAEAGGEASPDAFVFSPFVDPRPPSGQTTSPRSSSESGMTLERRTSGCTTFDTSRPPSSSGRESMCAPLPSTSDTPIPRSHSGCTATSSRSEAEQLPSSWATSSVHKSNRQHCRLRAEGAD